MRTTVDLPDDLYRTVKTAAVERGSSFKLLVREALEKAYVHDAPPEREKSWVRALRNPPFTKEEGAAMLEALAEADRVDVELQRTSPDPWS